MNKSTQAYILRLEAENAKQKKFAEAFLDNFKTCVDCGGDGFDKSLKDTCSRCRGTGEQIDSVGVLYVDLPNKARELLGTD
jgi:DnaJ-class molecular chaperone